MSNFSMYTHLEEKVEAIQLTPKTQSIVCAAIAEACIANLLTKLHVDFNNQKACLEFVYRYKTDTVESNLNVGDYLVRLNAGQYIVRTEEQFLEEYIHTAIDPIVPTEKQKTPKKALVDFITAFFPDAGIENEADLDKAALEKVAEGLNAWYDTDKNIFDIKFTDCSITDPTGIADIVKAFPGASFMNDETTFTLNFNNGAYHEGDPNTDPNYFNLIALQLLEGELKRVPAEMQQRLVGITFLSEKNDSPSAVTPSVTDEQWNTFVLNVMGFTAIKRQSDIKR